MREAQTASELMLENQLAALSKSEPGMVLPSRDVQKFFIEMINQTSFPGSMAEFVGHVKHMVAEAKVSE